jgi:HEPN domain-containing protein
MLLLGRSSRRAVSNRNVERSIPTHVLPQVWPDRFWSNRRLSGNCVTPVAGDATRLVVNEGCQYQVCRRKHAKVVEKAMKALLTWHDSAFRKTHNLVELGELCTRTDGTLAPAVEDVTPLTEYAARLRYPGAPWEPTLQETQESIELARTFVHTILKSLPPRVTSFYDRSKDSMASGA